MESSSRIILAKQQKSLSFKIMLIVKYEAPGSLDPIEQTDNSPWHVA
jgi:hypothetical protein